MTNAALRELTDKLILRDQDLWKERNHFYNLFITLPIPVAVVNLDGTVARANPALCEALGYTEEELIKIHFTEITHPEDVEIDFDLFGKVINHKIDNYQIDKRYIKKDGSLIEARLRVSPSLDQFGEITSVIGMFFNKSLTV